MAPRRKYTSATMGTKRTRSISVNATRRSNNNSQYVSAQTASVHFSEQQLQTTTTPLIYDSTSTAIFEHHPCETEKATVRSSTASVSSSNDEADALQRFSNTSTHPRRSHKADNNANKNNSPPRLSTTPPPPPHTGKDNNDDDGFKNNSNGIFPQQEEERPLTVYEATERDFYVCVSPSAARSERAGMSPSPSLLSELLLAEAERAEAAAAAAADALNDALIIEAPLPDAQERTTGLQTSSHPDLTNQEMRIPPSFGYGYPDQSTRSRRVSPPNDNCADMLTPLAVHIGVVPLPGDTNNMQLSTDGKDMLPWVRVLHAAAAAATRPFSRPATTVAEPPNTTSLLFVKNGNYKHSALDTKEEDIDCANIRYLRPHRLRTQSQTSSSTIEQHGAVPSPAFERGQNASAANPTEVIMTTTSRDVVGWSGLFPDVRILLHGAKSPASTGSPAAEEAHDDQNLPLGAQMCFGAATVMLMLA